VKDGRGWNGGRKPPVLCFDPSRQDGGADPALRGGQGYEVLPTLELKSGKKNQHKPHILPTREPFALSSPPGAIVAYK